LFIVIRDFFATLALKRKNLAQTHKTMERTCGIAMFNRFEEGGALALFPD